MNNIKLFFLGIGAFFASIFSQNQHIVNKTENTVLQSPTETSSSDALPKVSITIPPTESPAPNVLTPTPKPGYSLSDFFYPGATQIDRTDTSLTLTSTDDRQQILNWYEDTVNALKVAKNTSVSSSTNGALHANIDAANFSIHVVVHIDKNEGDNQTTISISVIPLKNSYSNTPDSDTTIINGSSSNSTTVINEVNTTSN